MDSILIVMKKTYYLIPKLNIFAVAAMVCMILSAAGRIIYFMGVSATIPQFWLQCMLPLCTALLFVVVLVFDGADRLYRTSVPVLMGCIFFAVKANDFAPTHRLLCWLLYLGVAVLYYVTVQKGLCKWIFAALIAAAMAYHIVVEDILHQSFRAFNVIPLAPGHTTLWHLWAEITVLLIMAALLLLTFAMVRQETDGWRPSWGDRNDGRRLRSLSPIFAVSPYFMSQANAFAVRRSASLK